VAKATMAYKCKPTFLCCDADLDFLAFLVKFLTEEQNTTNVKKKVYRKEIT